MPMKYFIILTSILFLFFCKKYTCECTAYNSQIPESGGKGTFTVKGSKEKAKTPCDSHKVAMDSFGNYTDCVIK